MDKINYLVNNYPHSSDTCWQFYPSYMSLLGTWVFPGVGLVFVKSLISWFPGTDYIGNLIFDFLEMSVRNLWGCYSNEIDEKRISNIVKSIKSTYPLANLSGSNYTLTKKDLTTGDFSSNGILEKFYESQRSSNAFLILIRT